MILARGFCGETLRGAATPNVTPEFEILGYNRHKTDDDFSPLLWDSKDQYKSFISSNSGTSLVSGALVKEFYYAIKGGSLRNRRE